MDSRSHMHTQLPLLHAKKKWKKFNIMQNEQLLHYYLFSVIQFNGTRTHAFLFRTILMAITFVLLTGLVLWLHFPWYADGIATYITPHRVPIFIVIVVNAADSVLIFDYCILICTNIHDINERAFVECEPLYKYLRTQQTHFTDAVTATTSMPSFCCQDWMNS